MRSEKRLARLAARGDTDAFAAIFRRYRQDLYRYCVAILGDPQDAQDALQSTMVKALAVLPGEQRQIELKPWLYRVAHNESIELRRRRRPVEPLAEDSAAPGSLEQTAADRGRLRDLLADIGELPDRQRGALLMRELAGLDFEEIAAALETSPQAARQVLYEARCSLQQMSEGREMDCDAVTALLSERDGRVARRRDVRAHLRDCPECRRFGEAIGARSRTLASISPLPAAAAAAIVKGALSGAAGGGASTGGAAGVAGGGVSAGAAGGAAAKAASTAAILKSAAGIVAVVAVGAVAVDHAHLLHGGGSSAGGAQAPATTGPATSGDPTQGGWAAGGGAGSRATAPSRLRAAQVSGRRAGKGDRNRVGTRESALLTGAPTSGGDPRSSADATHADPSGAPVGARSGSNAPQAHPRHPEHPAHPARTARPQHPDHPGHPVHPAHPPSPAALPQATHRPRPEGSTRPEAKGEGPAAPTHTQPVHPEHPSTSSTVPEPSTGAGATANPEGEEITAPDEGAVKAGTGEAAAPGRTGEAK